MQKSTPSIYNSRIKSVNLTIILAFIMVIARLFYWQVIMGNNIRTKNISQTSKLQNNLPNTGKILATDNFPLSLGQKVYKLSIYKPNLKISIDELFNKIEEIKPETKSKNIIQYNNLNNPNIKWVTLNSTFDQKQKDSLNLPGISFELSNIRYYPEGDLAKNLIINLESFYKRSLNGKMGFSLSSVDGTGQNILTNRNWQQAQVDGQDIKTGINRQVQLILEQTLKKGLTEFQAKSASGTIINPTNGQIIAMANFQSDTSPNTNISNITDLFEPGSIFKPLIITMALDS
jgi:cell division protein FtsI/penicillin-binding protein 2